MKAKYCVTSLFDAASKGQMPSLFTTLPPFALSFAQKNAVPTSGPHGTGAVEVQLVTPYSYVTGFKAFPSGVIEPIKELKFSVCALMDGVTFDISSATLTKAPPNCPPRWPVLIDDIVCAYGKSKNDF